MFTSPSLSESHETYSNFSRLCVVAVWSRQLTCEPVSLATPVQIPVAMVDRNSHSVHPLARWHKLICFIIYLKCGAHQRIFQCLDWRFPEEICGFSQATQSTLFKGSKCSHHHHYYVDILLLLLSEILIIIRKSSDLL